MLAGGHNIWKVPVAGRSRVSNFVAIQRAFRSRSAASDVETRHRGRGYFRAQHHVLVDNSMTLNAHAPRLGFVSRGSDHEFVNSGSFGHRPSALLARHRQAVDTEESIVGVSCDKNAPFPTQRLHDERGSIG